ncbi:MAG: family 43 glycosylhydrolase [Herbiconiux sp.]|nr:family 43 glycosylhydrolase [Herbiconiux sp.]
MGRYRNPILPGCHPDPSVCRVDDAFYLVTSTFEYLPGLPIHRSTNLVDWELVGHAIDRPEQLDFAGLPSSCGLFAPTIRHHGGRFFVVCTVVGPDDGSWGGRTGHFVVTAGAASGPWSDPVWIDGVGGFDPSLTFDGERVWLVGTEPSASASWPGQTDVWLYELDPVSLQPVSSREVIWHGAMVGAVWAEGPHLQPRPGGGWMLVAAEGGTAREHAVCVAYAEEITGPYVGDPANPRLSHRDLGRLAPIASVGHADLVDDGAGGTWATVLATHPVGGEDGLLGRQTHLVPVEWEDRRPVFAPGSGRVEEWVAHPGVPTQAAWPAVVVDAFAGPALDLSWNGVGRHPSAFAELGSLGKLGSRAGHLRLRGGAEPSGLGAQSFLGRRLPAASVDVAVVVDLGGSATGADADAAAPAPLRGGLLLRTGEHAHVELTVDRAGVVRCVSTASGVSRVVLATQPGATRRELGFEVRDRSARVLVDGVAVTTVDLSGLVPDPARGFVGVWLGPVAIGPDSDSVDVAEFTLSVSSAAPGD